MSRGAARKCHPQQRSTVYGWTLLVAPPRPPASSAAYVMHTSDGAGLHYLKTSLCADSRLVCPLFLPAGICKEDEDDAEPKAETHGHEESDSPVYHRCMASRDKADAALENVRAL
eukprot:scaffold293_cov121-Isochrysis_galbana.AAC.4